MAYVETFQDFAARNGNNSIQVEGSNRYLFSNGAWSDLEGRVFHAPPTDEDERLRLQLEYYGELRTRAQREFYRARSDFADQAALASNCQSVVPPPDNALEILEELRAEYLALDDKVRELERELSQTPAALNRKHREDADQERKAQLSMLYRSLASFRLGREGEEDEDDRARERFREALRRLEQRFGPMPKPLANYLQAYIEPEDETDGASESLSEETEE